MNNEEYISIPISVLKQYFHMSETKEQKMKPKEKKKEIRVYLEPKVKEQLKELSLKMNTSMSELVRDAIEDVYHFDRGKNTYTMANY